MHIEIKLCVDSKDLLTSLSKQRCSIARSLCGNVACIKSAFQLGVVRKITWIRGNINLADHLTKIDNPGTEALQLALHSVRLNLDFEDSAEKKFSEVHYG